MLTMLIFEGQQQIVQTLPCYHQPLQPGAPELPSKVTYFWGLLGHSEVIGNPGKREFEVPVWLTSPDLIQSFQLIDYMEQIQKRVGMHGQLIEDDRPAGYEWSPGMPYIYYNCTFLGFTPEAFAGQESAHPIRDDGHTLFPTWPGYQAAPPAWAIAGRFRWRQLII